MLGTYALSAGYYEAYYGQAQKVRTLIIRDYERAFDAFDVLVSPTSPTTAFRIGAKVDDPMAMYLYDVFTIPANLSGMPAISIPSGLDDRGLPVGVQLTAPVLEEDRSAAGGLRARAGDRVQVPASAGRRTRRLGPLAPDRRGGQLRDRLDALGIGLVRLTPCSARRHDEGDRDDDETARDEGAERERSRRAAATRARTAPTGVTYA